MGSMVEQSMKSRLFSDGGADRLEEKTSLKTDLTCCGSGRAETMLSCGLVSRVFQGARVACCMIWNQRIGYNCDENHDKDNAEEVPNLDHR